jgi:hypothetical protein
MTVTEAVLVDWADVPQLEREGWRISEVDVRARRAGHDHGVLMVREVETRGASDQPLPARRRPA